MASFGVLGAVGGAAGGFLDGLRADLEESRKMRLEEVRTRNRRETNRMNNEQRFDLSLQQMKAQQEMEAENAPSFVDDEYGGVLGQRNEQTNQFQSIPGTGSQQPASKVQEYERLLADGVDPADAQNRVWGGAASDVQRQGIEPLMEPVIGPDGNPVIDPSEEFGQKPLMRQVGYQYLENGVPKQVRYGQDAPARSPNKAPGSAEPTSADQLISMFREANPDASPEEITRAARARAESHFPKLLDQWPDDGATKPAKPESPEVGQEDPGAAEPTKKKYGASLGEIFGKPAQAIGGAISDTYTDFTQGANAKVAYDNYRRVRGLELEQIPLEVLEDVLPYLDDEESKEVQAAIASLKN